MAIKQVKNLKDISLLGESFDELADEIEAGRKDAANSIVRIAYAYDKLLRMYGNQEARILADPRTRWISKNTREMLRMVVHHDLDARVVTIPEPNLQGFLKELPYVQQQKLLDTNPFIPVYDVKLGKIVDVPYVDVTSAQTKVAYDHTNQRFRTEEEQRNLIIKENAKKKERLEKQREKIIAPYKKVGNTLKIFGKCEIGRNEILAIAKEFGLVLSPIK